jgi:hypothetical protein
MKVEHVPFNQAPHSSSVRELTRFSQASLFALELNMLRETLWNRAGGGFADDLTSDQVDFQGALLDRERFSSTFLDRELERMLETKGDSLN